MKCGCAHAMVSMWMKGTSSDVGLIFHLVQTLFSFSLLLKNAFIQCNLIIFPFSQILHDPFYLSTPTIFVLFLSLKDNKTKKQTAYTQVHKISPQKQKPKYRNKKLIRFFKKKKSQTDQNETRNLHKIPFNWFCVGLLLLGMELP